jgi:sugar phosphate isomerase/epimerase
VDARSIGLFSACLPGWDSSRVIEIAAALDFSAIEWACGPGTAIEHARAAPRIRERCRSAGLHISGLSVQDPQVTFAAPGRAAPYLRLATTLGAPHVRLFAPPYRGGSLEREGRRARDGVAALVELAAPKGLAVLVETSPGTLAPGPDLASALVEQHPPNHAGVVYDPGNMAIEGHVEPALAIARLGAHLRHVHVKNISWFRRNGSWGWRHASIAGGMLDWSEIVDALAAARYRGGFSIDHLAGAPGRARLSAEREELWGLVRRAFSPKGRAR